MTSLKSKEKAVLLEKSKHFKSLIKDIDINPFVLNDYDDEFDYQFNFKIKFFNGIIFNLDLSILLMKMSIVIN